MKLHEYQSKQIFNQWGIPIPKGKPATTPSEAEKIAAELDKEVVVKAQVLVGGRGKAGGIKIAKTPQDAEKIAAEILSMEIKGCSVEKVLIDEAADIKREIYLGITNDRVAKKPVMMASSAGGVDIEEVAAKTPDKIIKVSIDPLLGLRDYSIRNLAIGIELQRTLWNSFLSIAQGLWATYKNSDALLAEINPLVVTNNEQLIAVDGKMVLDDNALFRHQELADLRDEEAALVEEMEARQHGLTYIKLDGEIGCMVNGAGLAMATMDIIKHYGGSPANFLDIGGGASSKKVSAALDIILRDPNVRVILVNVFGGITRGDEVAKGIVAALNKVKLTIPMVVRLVGTNAEEGMKILSEANLITAKTLAEAAEAAVTIAKEQVENEHPGK